MHSYMVILEDIKVSNFSAYWAINMQQCLCHLGTLWLLKPFLQKSVKFFIDHVRPALGSVGWLSPCSKSLKIALFQTFSSWHPNTFYPTALYWPGTAFYWPSTTKYQIVPGPVPSHINQYHPTLTHYHQEPTRTAPYWPISTTYQPIPPHTDPASPSTNQHRPILTHYYHKPTSTALYWPSTTKYQPVPPHTDPLPPQTNQYRPILAKYHQVPTSLHCTERAMLQPHGIRICIKRKKIHYGKFFDFCAEKCVYN